MRAVSLLLLSVAGCAPDDIDVHRLDDGAGASDPPALAVAPDGRAVAVWRQGRGADAALFARARDHSGWGTAERLDRGAGVGSAHVVANAAGRFLAAWPRVTARRLAKPCVRRLEHEGWTPLEILDAADDGQATDPRAALDRDGRAQLVWERPHDGSASIVGGLQDGGIWSGGRLLERDRGDAYEPQVVADGRGGFWIAWYQNDGHKYNVMAARCAVDGSCAPAEVLGASLRGDAYEPRLAAGTGTVALAWIQIDGDQPAVWARVWRADRWSDARRISTHEASDPWPAVGADDSVWLVWNESTHIAGARLEQGDWRPALVPASGITRWQVAPVVAVDPHGHAAVAWYEGDDDGVVLMLATWSGGWSAPRAVGATVAARDVDADRLPRAGVGVDQNGWVHLVWSLAPTAGIWAAHESITGGRS